MNNNKYQTSIDFGIIGLGRFGYALAETLARAGKEVLVIDRDPDRVKAISSLVEQAYVTDKLDKDTLHDAGFGNCGTVIVCIAERVDVSILTTLNVIELGVPRVVAKAVNPDHGHVLQKIGAEVVYPEKDMAERLAVSFMYSDVLERIDLMNDYSIEELRVPANLYGKTLNELNFRKKFGLNVIAIISVDHTDVELTPDTSLAEGDVFLLMGKRDKLMNFKENFYP